MPYHIEARLRTQPDSYTVISQADWFPKREDAQAVCDTMNADDPDFHHRPAFFSLGYGHTPRAPIAEEVKGMTQAYAAHFLANDEFEYIAVWDHYISDGPGYAGWVAVALGGEPGYSTTFIKDGDRIVVEDYS